MTSIKQKFLDEVEAFMEKHKMKPSAFGEQFASSPSFVFDLRKGRSVKIDTMDRIQTKMSIFSEG